jgi:hypothetical protein
VFEGVGVCLFIYLFNYSGCSSVSLAPNNDTSHHSPKF